MDLVAQRWPLSALGRLGSELPALPRAGPDQPRASANSCTQHMTGYWLSTHDVSHREEDAAGEEYRHAQVTKALHALSL